MIDIDKVPSPCYVMDEKLLRKNLSLIKSVADKAGVEIILAFKSFAMWKSFPIFREYIRYTTASSVYEARLAYEEVEKICEETEGYVVPVNYNSAVQTVIAGDTAACEAALLMPTEATAVSYAAMALSRSSWLAAFCL